MGRRTLRAAEPRDFPRQNGHSPRAHAPGTQPGQGKNGVKGAKGHPGIWIKAVFKTPPIPSHR